jgi:23S rRNA (cytidine2498-2'-O)-methyltransferase
VLSAIVAHCRAGFEAEAARDLDGVAARARVSIASQIETGAGFVHARIVGGDAPSLRGWSSALASVAPVFVRSAMFGTGPHVIAAADARARPDRITPIVAAVESLRAQAPFGALWIEYPDTNDGKALSSLARSLHARLSQALVGVKLLDPGAAGSTRLHVMLRDGASAWTGVSDPAAGSPWPMGIARLRMPHGAASRSTLKLAEAFITFLGDDAASALRAGMRAVDLGAAPGGWTWQLAHRGLRVVAVDNGTLKGEVASDPLVTHVREDGLRYRPRRPVDWVTCDIVESPSRIAQLMGDWIVGGFARRAVFNLKLPMKKRYDEVERCRAIIAGSLARTSVQARLVLRQLYHDREEVTGYLAGGTG